MAKKSKRKRTSRTQSSAISPHKNVAKKLADQTITKNEERFLQILNPEGKIISGHHLIPPVELLVSAYRNMVTTRILDEKLIALQRQGRMGTYVSCSGQEASQIGAVMALSKEKDWIFPMYRDLGMMIQAGVSIEQLLNRMFGNSEDAAIGRDLPNLFAWKDNHVVSFAAPIASHLPLAVGYGIAARMRKDDLVTIATFGDGATSSGEFHVAMNFAGVYKAPTIFICENNQYAISVPISQQTASESIAIKSVAYGVRGEKIDGNDLFAVYATVKNALDRARKGEGPTLIECVTYRLGAHSTADDWKRYRSDQEVQKWKERDPITRLRRYLEDKKLWNEQKEIEQRNQIESEISRLITQCEKIPPPAPKSIFQDVFFEPSSSLKDQSKELLGF